jgi:hypothetical protein
MRLLAIIAMALVLPTLAAAQETKRFPELRPEQLTPEQKKWADSIALPPRNAKFSNFPYRAYAHSPELAVRLQALSDYGRWNTQHRSKAVSIRKSRSTLPRENAPRKCRRTKPSSTILPRRFIATRP